MTAETPKTAAWVPANPTAFAQMVIDYCAVASAVFRQTYPGVGEDVDAGGVGPGPTFKRLATLALANRDPQAGEAVAWRWRDPASDDPRWTLAYAISAPLDGSIEVQALGVIASPQDDRMGVLFAKTDLRKAPDAPVYFQQGEGVRVIRTTGQNGCLVEVRHEDGRTGMWAKSCFANTKEGEGA